MRIGTYLEIVEQAGGMTKVQAERAANAERHGGSAVEGFRSLLEAAGAGSNAAPEHDPIVPRVAELADLDPPVPRRTVEAVLETLGVRISEGEVEDLIERLPTELTGALERGLARSRKATRMSLDEFLAEVAERQDVDVDEAKRRARAVFAALRELVSSKELRDVESELPSQYAPLFSGVV